jgi:UDPglucose 6-dehydrogenase
VKTKIGVLGIWHLGSIYSACLADLGYEVVGWDQDTQKVAELNKGKPPLFEPGLAELLIKNARSGNLAYTTDLGYALKEAKYILITFDTPVDARDEVDLSPIFQIIPELAKRLEKDSTLVVSSQVPIGTCEHIKSMIKQQNPALEFDIAYCPENLRLGQAIQCFINPERIVIGADSSSTLDRVEELLTVIDVPKVKMDLRSAEMVKHALNTFLGMSISFSNEIANLCDELGADALKVMAALQSDARIGSRLPLQPGLGFAGGTLARDLKILHNLGEKLGCETCLVDAILKVNERQNSMVVKKIEKVYGKVRGLRIGVLGLTYKAGTSTLRRSAALEIIQELTGKGASVKAHDPKALLQEVQEHPEFEFCPDPYEVTKDSDALVIITDWPQFRELDFDLIRSNMRKPVLIDAKNMLHKEGLEERGFIYLGVGRGRKQ